MSYPGSLGTLLGCPLAGARATVLRAFILCSSGEPFQEDAGSSAAPVSVTLRGARPSPFHLSGLFAHSFIQQTTFIVNRQLSYNQLSRILYFLPFAHGSLPNAHFHHNPDGNSSLPHSGLSPIGASPGG